MPHNLRGTPVDSTVTFPRFWSRALMHQPTALLSPRTALNQPRLRIVQNCPRQAPGLSVAATHKNQPAWDDKGSARRPCWALAGPGWGLLQPIVGCRRSGLERLTCCCSRNAPPGKPSPIPARPTLWVTVRDLAIQDLEERYGNDRTAFDTDLRGGMAEHLARARGWVRGGCGVN